MTGGRSCRAVRAAVFAAACVLLAATGHALMSAAPLPWWALPSAGAVTFAGAWFLAGRERGVLVVTSASVVTQGALHAWFSFAQAAARPPAAGGTSLARQWARHLLCGAGGVADMSEADALRVVTDAGLAGRPHEAAGHAGPPLGLRDAAPPGHGGHGTTAHLASGGGHGGAVDGVAGGLPDGAPDGAMPGAVDAVDAVRAIDTGHAVDAVSGAAHGTQGLHGGTHGGHVMGGLHDLHDLHGTSGGDLMGGLHAGHDMGGMSPLGMLAAHLLAALLCGLWLAYGERAAFRMGRAVAGWLAAPLRLVLPLSLPLPPHRPRLRPRRDHGARRLRRLLLVHALTRRGPPPGLAVG
ncbi:hypothetical protein [Streptomyces longispororuber]|uniref:hypothetical protein n=1 Tax=Streptomyces longispororuber TaxID=68230 RepID=UPI0036FE6ADB